MSAGRPPPGSIPTLTEVVTWPASKSTAEPDQAPVPPLLPPPAALPEPAVDEAALVQKVLAAIEKQVDLMLEVRLREALAPVLVRATDALVRDARKELTSALRDVVARSVAHELGRRD